MIEGRNIVCIASNYFYDPTSKHHVMRLLAEKNHVIWVNYHASRRPQATIADAGAIVSKLRQIISGPRRVSENLTVITPLVLPMPSSRAAQQINRRLLVRQIHSVLRDLPARPVQLWSFAPDVDYLVGRLGEESVVYYCVDEFSEFAGYDREAIMSAEARLAHSADLVVTTSQALFESKRPLNSKTVLVTHGVDYEHFASAVSPEVQPADELIALPRPILGFWGMIQDWVDVNLLAEIARLRPNWSLVLIGEVLTDLAPLQGLANVKLLGRRPYKSLPRYAKCFDVGLIPFKLNDLTRAVNPIKLREYLSAGLPVVSTPLPEVENLGPDVSTAADAPAFVAACESAIASNNSAQTASRQQAMEGESWPGKLREICKQLGMAHRRSTSPAPAKPHQSPH
jgi:glycosyltransferase involved in cell wall biosynthesis